MNKQEFNGVVAKFLGLKAISMREETGEVMCLVPDRDYCEFNPYDDANDMLLLEKKLRMATSNESEDIWTTTAHINDLLIVGEGTNGHESRRACAEEYLKEWKGGADTSV